MALTDENGGMGTTMLVQPSGFGGNNGLGGGLFGGDLSILVLFFLFMMMGGWGNGFGGGFGGDGLYPWMNNSQNINNGFRDQMLATQLNGIQGSVTSGFGDIQTALCGGFAGVNAGIVGAQNAITQQMYANEIAGLERSFAAQTANTSGLTALQAQLAQCCCDNRAATMDTKYTIATEACANRTAGAENTAALLNAVNAGVQSIKDQLCQDKIDAKNDTIAQLRSELLYARGQASQDVQTAAIQAGQRGLANEVEQYVAPRAVPAYVVQNPNCCGTAYGCGA